MSEDTGWRCKNCGHFNTKTVLCSSCGARLGSSGGYKDYYRILQVDPSAEEEVILAAYKRLALKYHPDTNKSPDATARMQDLNESYGILANAAKRAQYDRERVGRASRDETTAKPTEKPRPSPPPSKPISPAAEDYYEAIELLQSANPGERTLREATSLLLSVTKNAETEFPLARSILAMVLMALGDDKGAEQHANFALRRNPVDFRAQYVRVQLASAKMKTLKTPGARGVLDLIAQGTATTLISGGIVMTTQLKFKDEVNNLIYIFQKLCSTRLPAVELLFLLEKLFVIAEFISENIAFIPNGKVNVYNAIANTQLNSVIFDTEEERKEARKLIRTAEGYSASFR